MKILKFAFSLALLAVLAFGLLIAAYVASADAYPDSNNNLDSNPRALFLRQTVLRPESAPTAYANHVRLYSATGTISFVNANGARISIGGTTTSTTWSCQPGDLVLNLAAAEAEPAFWLCDADSNWLRGPVIPSQ